MAEEKDPLTGKLDSEILTQAIKDFKDDEDSLAEIYKAAREDIKFVSSECQWDDSQLRQRKGRPSLTVNRVGAMVRQITNEHRQNRPQMRVRGVDDTADKKTANVINGLIRNIVYSQNGQNACDTASDYQVKGGIGYLRVITQYESDDSDNQEIRLKRIPDPMKVVFPLHLINEVDWSDAPHAFVYEDISKAEFKELYPDEDESGWVVVRGTGAERWVSKDTIRIAEMFLVKSEKVKRYRVEGAWMDEIPAGLFADKERWVTKKRVLWYKLTAGAILERGELPGNRVPIIPMVGEEIIVDGEKKFISAVRFAKDPNKMLNFLKSAEVEALALIPKAPFIGPKGSFEGVEKQWDASNTTNMVRLEYIPVYGSQGQLLPPPQRQQPQMQATGITMAIAETSDDIKSAMGMYNASLGAQEQEKSGKAIIARQREGDTANYHFFDNAAIALCSACRLIIDWIPEVYDVERTIRILGEDMREEVVQVNKEAGDGSGKRLYDLTVGRYDVIPEVGPSYSTRRQEIAEQLLNLAKTDPVVVQTARDLIAKALDMPQEIVERFAKTIPPEMADKGQDDPQVVAQQLTQTQQQAQQMDAVIQQMTQELEEMKRIIDNKTIESQLRLEIEKIKSDTAIKTTKMKHAHDLAMASHGYMLEATRGAIDSARGEEEEESPGPAQTAEMPY